MFGKYIGAKYAMALNSCTAGLHLATLVSGLGPGDEIITTPLTFAATANVIMHIGTRPVFVDVDERTMNIDPNLIEKKTTKRLGRKGTNVRFARTDDVICAVKKVCRAKRFFALHKKPRL